jgi:hypothetical protein
MYAVSLSRPSGGNPIASQEVLALGYHFHVERVYTHPVSAQMVDLQTLWNRSTLVFINEPVSRTLLLSIPAIAVAIRNFGPCPMVAPGFVID